MIRQTVLIAILAAIIGCEVKSIHSPTANNPPAATAAEIELQILDFEAIQKLIASKKGKVVVVDAWSTSCPPCMKEFPHLVALHKKHNPEDLAYISLSFDYEGIG